MPHMHQQRKAAIRQSLVWSSISYVPVVAGIAWFAFAIRHWSGSRGAFLAVSGLMVGIAASSALYLPVLQRLNPKRRGLFGISVARYTYISISAAIAIAAVLVVAAFLVPDT